MTTNGEQKRDQIDTRKIKKYVYTIGFFGGLFASGLAYIVHFLNFIPFGPGILLQVWPTYERIGWMRGPEGHFIGILLISVFSILVAYVYYWLFRKMNTVWVGIWYGLALWVIIFLGLHQMIPGVRSVWELGWNTNITLICVFILYGLFIGYSISYEYQEEVYEQEEAK